MGKVITLGLQKGGVSKSTTTGILAYLLAKDKKKVLVIDMDSQGNVTELLTDIPANEFAGKSVLEAIVDRDPLKCIYKVNEYLDILPANNYLANFARWLYTRNFYRFQDSDTTPPLENIPYQGQIHEQLLLTIEPLRDSYDYILIDTPPSLSEQTVNSLIASDYVIVLYECSKFCYSAIPNFMDSVVVAQNNSPYNVEIIGILRTLNDKRRSDAKFFNDTIAAEYPDEVFKTIITRKASTGRLPLYGFENNEELSDALSQYKSFYKEFKKRIGGGK